LNSHLPKFESETDALGNNGSGSTPQEKNKEINSKYIIEYFDKKKFKEFLHSKNTYPDGILQKFIDPKGDYNFTIRLHWSPKLCILEKTINTKKIHDTRFNLYERAVTYDGEEFQTQTEAIRGNNLPDRFEKIGSNIASHISNITLERIKIVRMILNFKIGKNDKIYFLWCSSLRIENFLDKKFNMHGKKERKHPGDFSNEIPFVSNCDTGKIQVTYPNSINLFQYSNQGKPIKVYKDTVCKNCDNKIEQHKMCDITFRTLVEAHDSRKRDKAYNKLFENINMTASGVELLPYIPNKGEEEQKLLILKNYKNLLMPKVIFALYPKLNYEDYKTLKKDTVFLSKNTQVCEKCFLDLTKYCNFAGANTENVLRVLKSVLPEDYYIRNESLPFNENNTSLNNRQKNDNISVVNSFKTGSKTPWINNMNYTTNNINRNIGLGSNINRNNMFYGKTNMNATGNIGSYTNFNQNNNSNRNKYMPDFSSKIKFIVPKKKEIKIEEEDLNTINGNFEIINKTNYNNHQDQINLPNLNTSNKNINYDEKVNSSKISASKNNSSSRNNVNINQQKDMSNYIKKKSSSKDNFSEKSMNSNLIQKNNVDIETNESKCFENNSKKNLENQEQIDKSMMSDSNKNPKRINNSKSKQMSDICIRKINENSNKKESKNCEKNENKEVSIRNLIENDDKNEDKISDKNELEIKDVCEEINNNSIISKNHEEIQRENSDKEDNLHSVEKEKKRQHDSDSDDDGYDNQSENQIEFEDIKENINIDRLEIQ